MQSRVQLINFLSTGMFISPVPLHAAALASLRLQHGGPAPTDPEAVSERLRANSDFSLGTPATST